jgi:hypothetical protein
VIGWSRQTGDLSDRDSGKKPLWRLAFLVAAEGLQPGACSQQAAGSSGGGGQATAVVGACSGGSSGVREQQLLGNQSRMIWEAWLCVQLATQLI